MGRALALLWLLFAVSHAALISLLPRTGGGALLFSDPTSWSGGVVPGPADDVVVLGFCGTSEWLVLDVAATVGSLTTVGNAQKGSTCSAPSVRAAARLRVLGRCSGGVDTYGLFLFEPLSSIECDSVVLGHLAVVAGSGSFVSSTTFDISGSIWLGNGRVGCCDVGFWPGQDKSLPALNNLVFAGPDILLNQSQITICGVGQFVRFEGRLNSVDCSVLILPNNVSSVQAISWTSISSNSSFRAEVGAASLAIGACLCETNIPPHGDGNVPDPACASPDGSGLTIVASPVECDCGSCPSSTHCAAGRVCACDNGLDSPLCITSLSANINGTISGPPSAAPGGLSGGAIAGIVVGSVVLAGVVVAAIVGVKMHAAKSAETMTSLRMNANPTHQ
jgi:hypothetical protein